MQQEFRAPVENVRFAWVEFGCALILSNRPQRIAQFLVYLSKQMMQFGVFLMRFVLNREQRRTSLRACA